MPQSFGSIQVHLVFSTKNREPWIAPAIAERLYDYLGGTLRGNNCSSIAIGGIADHIHLLVSMSREFSASQLIRVLKSNSSRWIHDTFPTMAGFAWQSGYGAFSVSYSQIEVVKAYILNQEQHHKKQTFQDEFLALLEAHRLEWDERYVWN